MLKQLLKNPFVLFLPVLAFYVLYVLRYRYPELYGDETRYLMFANNLLHAFYSPPPPDINLWNGPGYPVFLMPFVWLKVPFRYIPLSNAFLFYLSGVLMCKALRTITNYRIALVFSMFWVLNPNMSSLIVSILTETISAFLLTCLLYFVTKYYSTKQMRFIILAGLSLGYLALVKVIFGYVILAGLILCLIGLLFIRLRGASKSVTLIFSTGLIVTLPYLIYTYTLTHKVFYWGNSGGMSLYWMSTPYDDEYGDWKDENLINATFPSMVRTAEGDSLLRKNHHAALTNILSFKGIRRDSAYKAAAVANIKAHPKKFVRNYFNNWCRMFFDFPYSYYYHHSSQIRNLLVGSLYLWSMLIAAALSIYNWRHINYPVAVMLVVLFCYLGLVSVLSAYPRFFDIVSPLVLFWFGFVVYKLPPANIKFELRS